MTLPTAGRTGTAAIEYARSRSGGTMPASGYCLQFTRECYAVPAVYGSAVDAAQACDAPHPGDRNPPAGVPIWFWTPNVYDHICFYVGPHEAISTYNDRVKTFDGIAGIEANFGPGGGPGAIYAGWGEHLNEHIVYTGDQPPPDEGDDDVRPMLIRDEHGTVAIVTPVGVRAITPAQLETWWNLGYRYSPGMEAMQAAPFQEIVASLGGWVA